jgi:hypothetical protein
MCYVALLLILKIGNNQNDPGWKIREENITESRDR